MGRYLNTREAAKRLGFEDRTIQRWCKEGKIRGAHHVGREWRIPESEIERHERGEIAASPELEKTTQQDEVAKEVPRELIPEIRKLAKRLEQLTHMPEPERPLLSESRQAMKEVEEASLKGNTHPCASVIITGMKTPWWSDTGTVRIKRHLRHEEEALFNRFIALSTSQKLKILIAEWEEKANRYLKLMQLGADAEETERAYWEAKEAEQRLHSELADVVESLRW